MGPAAFPAALAKLKEPPPTGSWRVQVITKDGKRWVNGSLETKEEAYDVYRAFRRQAPQHRLAGRCQCD